jgi:hypothetical protein
MFQFRNLLALFFLIFAIFAGTRALQNHEPKRRDPSQSSTAAVSVTAVDKASKRAESCSTTAQINHGNERVAFDRVVDSGHSMATTTVARRSSKEKEAQMSLRVSEELHETFQSSSRSASGSNLTEDENSRARHNQARSKQPFTFAVPENFNVAADTAALAVSAEQDLIYTAQKKFVEEMTSEVVEDPTTSAYLDRWSKATFNHDDYLRNALGWERFNQLAAIAKQTLMNGSH